MDTEKTPLGAGTHTGHTGAHRHTDHTDESPDLQPTKHQHTRSRTTSRDNRIPIAESAAGSPVPLSVDRTKHDEDVPHKTMAAYTCNINATYGFKQTPLKSHSLSFSKSLRNHQNISQVAHLARDCDNLGALDRSLQPHVRSLPSAIVGEDVEAAAASNAEMSASHTSSNALLSCATTRIRIPNPLE